MPFAVVKNEKTIDELVTRLFSQDGKITKTVAKQATTALLKANPHLEDMAHVPPGSMIRVPETAPPLASSEQVKPPDPALSVAASRTQNSLDLLASRMAAIDAMARDASKTITELSKNKPPQLEEQDELPDLLEVLSLQPKAAQANAKDLETNLKSRAEALASVQDFIATLVQK